MILELQLQMSWRSWGYSTGGTGRQELLLRSGNNTQGYWIFWRKIFKGYEWLSLVKAVSYLSYLCIICSPLWIWKVHMPERWTFFGLATHPGQSSQLIRTWTGIVLIIVVSMTIFERWKLLITCFLVALLLSIRTGWNHGPTYSNHPSNTKGLWSDWMEK